MKASRDNAALASLLLRPRVRRLLEALDGRGEETRIVGGAVRNVLLGRPVTEVDFATTSLPDAVRRRAKAHGLKTVPTGLEHGTMTVIVDGEPFEVTTLREDIETDGRRAVVRFGRDFGADARRRDFTINALSLGADGRLHDHVGGLDDLDAGRVRFIGDPAARIREDYLRILRFFRFHGDFALGAFDPAGLAAVIAERAGLARLSRERIRAELLKLLVTRRAVESVAALADCGIYEILVGGVPESGRLARVVGFETGAEPADPVRRLAALCVMTVEDAERLRQGLRLSNDEHRRLHQYAALLAVLKSRAPPIDRLGVRRLVVEHGLEAIVDAFAAVRGEPCPMMAPDAGEALQRFRSGEEPVPVFPLRGADLVVGGVPHGPQIGLLLEKAREAWLASGCPTGKAVARQLLARTLAEAKP